MKKNNKDTVSKDDFISFLASSTPEELNKLIETKGKPPKLICPMFFFPRDDK